MRFLLKVPQTSNEMSKEKAIGIQWNINEKSIESLVIN